MDIAVKLVFALDFGLGLCRPFWNPLEEGCNLLVA